MLFTKITYLDNTYHIPLKDNIVHCEIMKDKFYILFHDGTQYRVYDDLIHTIGDFSISDTNLLTRSELIRIKDTLINDIMTM